jgi:hypothetical protein
MTDPHLMVIFIGLSGQAGVVSTAIVRHLLVLHTVKAQRIIGRARVNQVDYVADGEVRIERRPVDKVRRLPGWSRRPFDQNSSAASTKRGERHQSRQGGQWTESRHSTVDRRFAILPVSPAIKRAG